MAHNQHRIRPGDPRGNLELNHTYPDLPVHHQGPQPGLNPSETAQAPPLAHPAPAREVQLHRAPHLGAPQKPCREPTQ